MGPTTVGPALSVRQLLIASPESARNQIDKQLDKLVRLPAGISRDQSIEAILGLLDIPLADVLFAAWEQYNEVRKAKVETRDHPGTVQQVRIAGHTLTSTHHPSLQCDLDGKNLFVVQLQLDLSLHLTAYNRHRDLLELLLLCKSILLVPRGSSHAIFRTVQD
jgi:hypothetical protein